MATVDIIENDEKPLTENDRYSQLDVPVVTKPINDGFYDESPFERHPKGFWEEIKIRYGPVPFQEGFPALRLIPWLLFVELKENWRAGGTVALVNIPLSISLAVAAGATPMQGIATSVWAGILFGLFGGCNYNIVGPTGALSGLLMMYSIHYGGSGVLSLLAILAGLLLFIMLLLRLDLYLMFIPSSVIHGFTVGVACIIALGQLSYALGITGLQPEEQFYMNVWNILTHMDQTNPWAVLVSALTVILLLGLIYKFPMIPWNIILALIGVLFGWLISEGKIPMNEYRILALKDKFGDIESDFFTVVTLQSDWYTLAAVKDLLLASFNIMFVAALETLISAKIASDLTHTEFNQTWEVFGLALSNLVSGLFGGLPCTAALARTALNVKSGATSRFSSILNGFLVMIVSLAVLQFFTYLLQPVVAGIVIVVAIKMVEYNEIVKMFKHDKGSFFIGLLTVLICIFDNPTDGIMVGTVVSLLRLARYTSQLESGNVALDGVEIFVPIEITTGDSHKFKDKNADRSHYREGKVLLFTIPGNLTFLNAQSYINKAQRLQNKFKFVIISMRLLAYIDLDGVMALSEIVNMLEKKGTSHGVLISGLKHELEHYSILSQSMWFRSKLSKGEVFSHYTKAVEYLRSYDNDIEQDWAILPESKVLHSMDKAESNEQSKNKDSTDIEIPLDVLVGKDNE